MDFEECNKELWGWEEQEPCLQRERSDISHYMRDEVNQIEDDLLCMLEKQTPIKSCTDLDCLNSDSAGEAKNSADGSEESSQLKRRRMLQFNYDDPHVLCNSPCSEFLNPKIAEETSMGEGTGENRQLGADFLDIQGVLDQSSECWLESCFNEGEMLISADQVCAPGAATDHASGSEPCNSASERESSARAPVLISTTPRSEFKGRKLYFRTPTKMTSSIIYPFALIKPCEVRGDVTLKDINRRLQAPLLSPASGHQVDEASGHRYPTSAFSGKPVVVKTKINTEGGKGSITIMRTKG